MYLFYTPSLCHFARDRLFFWLQIVESKKLPVCTCYVSLNFFRTYFSHFRKFGENRKVRRLSPVILPSGDDIVTTKRICIIFNPCIRCTFAYMCICLYVYMYMYILKSVYCFVSCCLSLNIICWVFSGINTWLMAIVYQNMAISNGSYGWPTRFSTAFQYFPSFLNEYPCTQIFSFLINSLGLISEIAGNMDIFVYNTCKIVVVVQPLTCVWFFVTPWTAAWLPSLSFTVS